MKPQSIYLELEEKALPCLEAYHNDLIKHDKAILNQMPGVPFLHFTGTTGTTIVMMPTANSPDYYPEKNVRVPYLFGTADRHHILRDAKITVDALERCNRTALILHYNGINLRETSYNKAKEIIESYVKAIEYSWRS